VRYQTLDFCSVNSCGNSFEKIDADQQNKFIDSTATV
jgi:hypothetical protein